MLTIKINDMGSGVFFTSDLHFRHGNIIKYCNRPFETVQEQTEKLIENWNKTVPDTATVFILGDFAFASKNQWRGILNQLTGKKYLILGNHDRPNDIPEEMFEGICDIAQISVKISDGYWETFILSHRPKACWEGSDNGVKHLFGHVHSGPKCEETNDIKIIKMLEFLPMLDVGVDNNDYKPISVIEVLEKISEKVNEHCI